MFNSDPQNDPHGVLGLPNDTATASSSSSSRRPTKRSSRNSSLFGRLENLFFQVPIPFGRRDTKKKVTHAIFFDFDRTLTVVHVFKSLAGWVDEEVGMLGGLGSVPKPHALTERGQLKKTCQLGIAWIEQAFGGPARVSEIRSLLARLASESGTFIVLLTRGYIGVARKCLKELGLLQYFDEVYGNIGAAYGRRTKFDQEAEGPFREDATSSPADCQEEEDTEGIQQLLGDAAHGSWESKAGILLKYKAQFDLPNEGVIFIDDDEEETWAVNHCVATIKVRSPAGITLAEVKELLDLVGIAQDHGVARSLQNWAALPDPLTCRPPPIMSFNRAHLPVLLGRHLTCLEKELLESPNPMRRIKLLLREPLLLLSVAHREFVRQQLDGKGGAFSARSMKPMLQCMQAQLGLRDDLVEVAEDEDDFGQRLVEGYEAVRRAHSSSSSVSEVSRLEGEESHSDNADEQEHQRGVEHKAKRNSHLYAGPAASISRTAPEDPARLLCDAVSTFQRCLLGLTPITLTVQGDRRPVWGVHECRKLTAETAVWSRYERLDRLGAGHFGEVYQARQVCSGKEVAVKMLERIEHDKELIEDDDEDRSYQEANVLKALAHPNLLRIFEAVKTTEEVHIVCEFASGGSLSAYSRKNPVGAWIPGCMQQILSAVAYCHHRYVLHGDLKPENVLVGGTRPDKSPLCIVCDFGHTTICIGAHTPIAAPGDPRYIAPEVMAEEFLSPKSDIYMLGVTAYELLSGGWLPFFNQKAVTLHASYYQLKLGGVKDRILSQEGLGWRDWERLRGTPKVAQEAVRMAMMRTESDRPTACEFLQCAWLEDACRPCKAAYDAMFGGSGWGLWSPQHPKFVERLERRANQSWAYRWLCSLIGMGLHADAIQRMRLLFRRMDIDGNGVITRKKFQTAAQQHGLSIEQADLLFKASDIGDRNFLDFKDLLMLCLDLKQFSDLELLRELRSVLCHLQGPRAGSAKEPRIPRRPRQTPVVEEQQQQKQQQQQQSVREDAHEVVGDSDHNHQDTPSDRDTASTDHGEEDVSNQCRQRGKEKSKDKDEQEVVVAISLRCKEEDGVEEEKQTTTTTTTTTRTTATTATAYQPRAAETEREKERATESNQGGGGGGGGNSSPSPTEEKADASAAAIAEGLATVATATAATATAATATTAAAAREGGDGGGDQNTLQQQEQAGKEQNHNSGSIGSTTKLSDHHEVFEQPADAWAKRLLEAIWDALDPDVEEIDAFVLLSLMREEKL